MTNKDYNRLMNPKKPKTFWDTRLGLGLIAFGLLVAAIILVGFIVWHSWIQIENKMLLNEFLKRQ